MKNILFVCTGNTCRSSMAKGIMENALAGDPQLHSIITVDSSGISATPNEGASTNSIIVLKEEFGIDISSHKAKLFNFNIGSKADIILTMTTSHKNTICNKYPSLNIKTFTLKEYINKNLNTPLKRSSNDLDISDPYGMPENIYKQCALELYATIIKLLQILKNKL